MEKRIEKFPTVGYKLPQEYEFYDLRSKRLLNGDKHWFYYTQEDLGKQLSNGKY